MTQAVQPGDFAALVRPEHLFAKLSDLLDSPLVAVEGQDHWVYFGWTIALAKRGFIRMVRSARVRAVHQKHQVAFFGGKNRLVPVDDKNLPGGID